MKRIPIGRRSAVALIAACCIALAGCRSGSSQLPSSAGSAADPGVKTDKGATSRAQADSLAVSPGTLSLAPGAKQALTVTAVQKDQKTVPVTKNQGVSFSSTAPDVVVVSESGVVTASAQAKTGQTAIVKVTYMGLTKELPVTVKASLDDTIAVTGGIPTVTNSDSIDVVVNKKRFLPSSYIPKLVEPNVPFTFKGKSEKRMMRPEAAQALESLFAGAKNDGITLYGVSAYRSYVTQKSIYEGNVKSQGEKEASQFSAKPGTSEHQTGLAIDVSDGDPKCLVEQCFASSKAAKWLEEHAAEYGYIIRYLKGKESITGYSYEPWHIRYVGKEVAAEIAKQGITLEEYFQDAVSAGAKPAGGGNVAGSGSAK